MTAGLPDRAADREREFTRYWRCPVPDCDWGTHIFPRDETLIAEAHAAEHAAADFLFDAAAALAARPAPDDGEALPGPLDDRCGCRRGMGRRDPACHSYGLCGHAAPSSPDDSEARQWPCVYDYERTQCIREGHDHAAPSSPGSGDALHDKLAEALPEAFGWARWDVAVIRRAATALLPVVREAIADAVATELEGWAKSFRAVGAAAIRRENKRVYPQVADVLEAGARDVRADALRDGTRA